MGRIKGGPNKYDEVVKPKLDLIGAWVRDGYTLEAIAAKLEIGRSTLSLYLTQHQELADVFKESREKIDLVDMVNAYKQRAQGYTTIVKTKKYKYIDGERVLVEEYEKEQHVPADPRTLEHWLLLRLRLDPEWGQLRDAVKESREMDMNIDTGGVIMIEERGKAPDDGCDMETPT